MNFKTLLLFFLFNLPIVAHSQCQQPILLNNWTAQGGNWIVNPNNISVLQTLNGPDVYFLSPDNYINALLTGNFITNDNDDDVMGFVFGVEGTIGTAPYHFYRFQWDEGGLGNGMFINEISQTGTVNLYSNPGNHWTRSFNHNFSIVYKSTYIEVYVDGNFKTKIFGCFNPGKFGFYNRSQAQVTYSNFTYKVLADFSGNDSVCQGENINLRIFCNNNTVHNYSSIQWDLGDGTIVNDSIKYTHQYQQPGNYTVKLTVQDAFSCSDSISKQVTIYPRPVANYSSTNVCLNEATAFTDSSTINASTITGWQWDFNSDGTFDNTAQHPAYTYPACGELNAKLIVTSGNGCKDSISKAITINCLPEATFNADPVCENQVTVFTDYSIGTIAGWNWSFGDNNSSIQQNPAYTYAACGNFDCKLLVTSDAGCIDSITKAVIVNCLPVANFSYTDVCLNELMYFNDSSAISNGTISNWSWNFGDGSPLNDTPTPSHLYATHGTYSVSLIVSTTDGCKDTITKNVVVHPLPTALFSTADVCDGASVQFNYLSTIPAPDIIQNKAWSFGDGNTINNIESPAHLYAAAGSYPVSLLVISNFGCADSTTKTVTVNPNPVVNFAANDTIGCAELCVSFQDLTTISTGSIAGWVLGYGDGSAPGNSQDPNHCYINNASPAAYDVTLAVTSDKGCLISLTKNNYIAVSPNPTAQFSTANVCDGTAVQFVYLSTIPANDAIQLNTWVFGDGNSDNSVETTTHLYASAGFYSVGLGVVSSFGCTDSITKVVTVNPNPVVSFAAIDTIGCEPFCINFLNSSTILTGGNAQLAWNIGDGSAVSNSQSVEHCYTNDSEFDPAFFNVTLTVTSDSGCISTLSKNSYITVYPAPVASFTALPQTTIITDPVITVADFSSGTNTWTWNFGDGPDTSSFADPAPHTYADTGSYTITLITSTQYNCADTAYETIIIEPDFVFYIPNAFSPDGDGINDNFSGKGIFINTYEMSIYNRWGNLIFFSDDIDKPWNGKANQGNEPAQADVYVYSINVSDFKKKNHSYKGIVTLLR